MLKFELTGRWHNSTCDQRFIVHRPFKEARDTVREKPGAAKLVKNMQITL